MAASGKGTKVDDGGAATELGLGEDPLDGARRDPLLEAFYGPPPAKRTKRRASGRQPLKDGKTFRLVTFSFYEDDVARLDELLQEARRRGLRKASRSQIVRLALRQVDITQLPDEI